MMWLVEHWAIGVCGIAVVFVGILACWKFFKMPRVEQIAKVKEWLLWACTEAEKELGSGTGDIKLRQVYDLFVQRFPTIAMVVSFDTFAAWVFDVLETMRAMIKDKPEIRMMVGGGSDV